MSPLENVLSSEDLRLVFWIIWTVISADPNETSSGTRVNGVPEGTARRGGSARTRQNGKWNKNSTHKQFVL